MAMIGGANAFVTLMKCVAHEMGMFYVGALARDPRGVRHGPAAVCLQISLWCARVVAQFCLWLGLPCVWLEEAL
ncbi:hypothetical protein Taro_020391 [Colocasia esculenta]|uniref:Uncharacterized protein n=1 Tax=Colocasia esculenta TaxID=4460 RepID=A0A843UNK0_COLES|nr:hypothetical protein [Colocasia esculenta]